MDWLEKTWDNWLLAIAGVPLIVHWGPDITKLLWQFEWTTLGYGVSGLIIQAAYWRYKEYRIKAKR